MRAATRRGVVLVVLLAVTATAAVVLLEPNLDAWTWFNNDPQGFDQELAAWRIAVASGYTSGALVGLLAALLFGCFAGWGAAPAGVRVAVLGGALLALVNATVAALVMRASPVDRLWMVEEMRRHGHAFEPALHRHGNVVVVIVIVYLSFPLCAALGYGAGRLVNLRFK